jgi:hypothetical protein
LNDSLKHDRSPSSALSSAGSDVVRAYEDAATAIGRLDATGRLASAGLQELLVLRCIAAPSGASHTGMIALVRPDGEGDGLLRAYGNALRDGAARARGGALASVSTLHELLRLPLPAWPASPIDELLRDTHERTPPVLKAALAALALRAAALGELDETTEKSEPNDPNAARLVALAVTLLLCVGGATTDAWLTLPSSGAGNSASHADLSLGGTFAALAREARAAERGLLAARDCIDTDQQRVRDSLGRAAYSALDVLALLGDKIVITVPETARALGLTPPTAGAAVARLVELGIAREVTGKARSRAFAYEGIVRALEPGSAGKQ